MLPPANPVFRQAIAISKVRAPSSVTARYVTGGGATRHGNDPEVLDKGKQDALRKRSKNSAEEPHWQEEVASDSEAFVKAYRGEIDASAAEIAKLQEKTKNPPKQ